MIRVTREDWVLTASERFAIEEAISECSTKEFDNMARLGRRLDDDERDDIVERTVELWKAMPALVADAKTWCFALCNDAVEIGTNERLAASILLDAIEKFQAEHAMGEHR